MHDTFVDTPDRAILASGHVCRQREVDGQIVMTLKSGQTVEGAVHRREELEITLKRELPIGQWPPGEIRDRLLGIVGDVELVPLFDQHQTRIIRWASHADRVVAEMSVDQVELSINGREQGYLEVEFELKVAGTEDDLAAIAACLQNDWKLKPEPRSKFARALALASE
jgi:inorganic triphosphatase YgiF